MSLPTLNTPQVDLGNILRTVAAIRESNARVAESGERVNLYRQQESESRTAQRLRDLEIKKGTAEFEEWQGEEGERKKAREAASKLLQLQLSEKQIDLITKATGAINNELMSLTVDQYPAFIEKWSNESVDMSAFPDPSVFGNDPEKFNAFKRQKAMNYKFFQEEMLEAMRQAGLTNRTKITTEAQIKSAKEVARIQGEEATNRAIQTETIRSATAADTAERLEKIRTEGAKERATAVEAIRSDAALERLQLELDSALKTGKGYSGEMGWFVAINGRKPIGAKEFANFRRTISTDTDMPDNLVKLKNDYFKTIGRANNALMGVDMFLPDERREEVAQNEYRRAEEIKKEFVRQGGRLAQLGLQEPSPTPAEKTPPGAPTIEHDDIAIHPETKQEIKWNEEIGDWVDLKTGNL
jgi:hypothetical protein